MNRAVAQLIFSILLLLLFIYTAIEARTFAKTAKYFPLYISIAAIAVLCIEIIRQIIKFKEVSEKGELLHPNIKGVIKYSLILFAYGGLVYIVGVLVASAIYVFVFLFYIAKMRLLRSIITVTILIVFLIVFADAMNLYWPKSIFEFVPS